MNTEQLSNFEREAIDKLLAGEHPILAGLREQARDATVISREFTGSGLFTTLSPAPTATRLPLHGRLALSDVGGQIAGLQYPAGFILFVEDGLINMLECFSFEDDFPETPTLTRIYYLRHEQGHQGNLVETATRDIQSLLPAT